MQNFLRNNIKAGLILGLLILVYFAVRLPHLTMQPIFADEAIYIRWAQVMRAEPTLRFVSLMDGKTPLFMWLMIPFFKVFDDPLLAGRLLSVFAGLGTVIGVLFIGWLLFNRKVGLWAAFLVTITPFFVFFDRMALVDSMLAAFSVWSIGLALLLVKFPRWDLAMVLGYSMGAALLTKTPAFFTIITMPLSILIFNFKVTKRQQRIVKLFGLWIVAIVITLGIYNILRLGPGFSNLNSRNQDYVLSPLVLLERPWDPFLPHLWDLTDFLPKLLGLGVLGFLGVGVVLAFWKRNIRLVTLLLCSLIPLGVEMALLRTFTARYILFTMPYLIIIAAFAIDAVTQKLKTRFGEAGAIGAIGLLLLIWPVYFVYLLNFDLAKTPLPRIERQGYLSEWTAGYGMKEIATYLELESKKKPIVVGTQGAFGTLPEGVQIYLDKARNISLVTSGATVSAEIRNASREHPTYYIANPDEGIMTEEGLELIMEYPKIPGIDGKLGKIQLFKVLNQVEASAVVELKGESTN